MAKKKTDWTLEKRFGERITGCRKKLGLTQEQLAHDSGLSPSTIQKYEAGEREPRARALLQLAEALKTDASTLLKDSQWVPPKVGRTGYIKSRLRPLR